MFRILLISAAFICTGSALTHAGITLIGENHPNLFYNQAEIDQMRRMILTDRSPSDLVNMYNNYVKGRTAVNPPSPWSDVWKDSYTQAYGKSIENVKAAFSYMIEPTQAKAQAIKSAMYAWKAEGIDRFTDPLMNGFADYPLPWLFDLTYHSGVYSTAEKAELKNFFTEIARQSIAYYNNQKIRSDCGYNTTPRLTQEGITKQALQNHYSFYVGNNVCCALVGNDLDLLKYITESNCKKVYDDVLGDGFSFAETGCYLRGLYQYAAGMVFPSGASYDYYFRTPYNHYHDYSLIGVSWGLEAAYHNGLNLWPVDNHSIKRAFAWAQRNLVGKTCTMAGSETQVTYMPNGRWGHAVRHYWTDPDIAASMQHSNIYSSSGCQHIYGEIGMMFSYPRQVLRPGDGTRKEAKAEAKGKGEIAAWPNPFTTMTSIRISSEFRVSSDEFRVIIFDLQGRKLATRNSQLETSFTWNAPGLPSGIYIVRLEHGTTVAQKRLTLLR